MMSILLWVLYIFGGIIVIAIIGFCIAYFGRPKDPYPLITAVKDNKYNKVLKLINNGVDVNDTWNIDYTKRASGKIYPAETALMIAVMNKNYNIVKLLLENGANVNAVKIEPDYRAVNYTKNIDTALSLAVERYSKYYGEDPILLLIAGLLLQYGADKNITIYEGLGGNTTVLMNCVTGSLMKQLLNKSKGNEMNVFLNNILKHYSKK